MPSNSKKRANESDSTVQRKSKKLKSSTDATVAASDEVDFPRGGGTSFTPLEVKTIRAEAVKEANEELFQDDAKDPRSKKRKRHSEGHAALKKTGEKMETTRIEHLNYKRLYPGMKIFGQIASIQSLALIISLPNQLFAHVPITNISSQLTELLEKVGDDSSEDSEDEDENAGFPDLSSVFSEGQYIRAVVTAVHSSGSTDQSGLSKSRDELVRASRRVELTLVPEHVNRGVSKTDLKPNFTITGAVKSVEDHGYVLDLGVSDMTGFLSFKVLGPTRYRIGQLLDVTVLNQSSNGRTCGVTTDRNTFIASSSSEVSNVLSVLPGTLVSCLITSVSATGLNVQVLGFFPGTLEELHLLPGSPEETYVVGKKIKARVLYELAGNPSKFALAHADHIVKLTPSTLTSEYPLGRIVQSAKIVKVEPERGVMLEMDPGVKAFAHISHLSDEHLPTIPSTSYWKSGSLHRARIIGYFHFDGIIQVSLKSSVLEKKLMRVDDVQVGQVIKGTIKSLTPSGLFVSIDGSFDAVVWPNHYADIVLKNPSKRFKPGSTIKCRILHVDPERRRIALTAKKSLVESDLPIVSSLGDAQVGLWTHAVVIKVLDAAVLVELYNNLKAIVPERYISETPLVNLKTSFPIGKVVKVCITSVNHEEKKISASIREPVTASAGFNRDLTHIAVGDIVEGAVVELHKDNVILRLAPSGARALLSIKNLANHRGVPSSQTRAGLNIGEELSDLVVVTRNVEEGFLIVANKPKKATEKGLKSLSTTQVGQIVTGKVTQHTRNGAFVKLGSHLGGILHPTSVADDYSNCNAFPSIDTQIRAIVTAIESSKRQLILSSRPSRMSPDDAGPIVDQEINTISHLNVGDTVRGFIKSVADHGVFVTIGYELDARVQIRELFDDYVKDWKSHFQVNQLVQGRILSVDAESKKLEMTLRSGDLIKRSPHSNTVDLEKGQKVDGIISRIENYGLFIQLDRSKLNGLCHKSQLSDNPESDPETALQGFRVGDRVKVLVLDIDKRRISLSLKPSHFSADDFKEGDPTELAHDGSASSSDESEEATGQDLLNIDLDLRPYRSRPHSPKLPDGVTKENKLKVSGGFEWFANPQASSGYMDSSDSSDEDEDHDTNHPKKRRRKQVELDRTAEMHNKQPESNADFERLLLGSPNSSYLWVQYMSFQLQLSEVDKAREISRRALKTIHFREENEKLNVWIALLNLECACGTSESLESVFKEAAKANDSKIIHLRMASILDGAGKQDKTVEHLQRTCKKFGSSSKVWTSFCEYHLRQGAIEDARKLLPRALQSLEKRKHLKTISRFAQLEYKLGEAERGKTLFEGMVDSHPKRWDLWSIYIDMEAGQGDIQSLRNIFDRVLAIKMTSHKAKSFFKKWLELERRIGDEDGANAVKEKAVEWTRMANSTSS